MNIRNFCEMIAMPEEVTQEIEKLKVNAYKDELEQYWILIQDKAKWDTALERVKKLCGNDPNGLKCLAFMLQVGLRTYQEYLINGISEQIFVDTMGCFSRFVKEYKESFGTYGFDREWWTVRELSLLEFRLGELEYEMTEEDNKKVLSVHIPSDAKMENEKCRDSYKKARSFFSEFAAEYVAGGYYCDSWLLSPNLSEILSETSNIISFQRDFIIDSFLPEKTDYMQWVFKNENLSLEEVPQDTSLQRKMKAYLQNGGKIGVGSGYVKSELYE